MFFWEDYGFWCFTRFADVSALLRDRRFGRRTAEPGPRETKPHLAPFDALERLSMLELEPPEHTRLRSLVNRAFVSRRIEKLGPEIARLAHERIDAFASKGSADLVAEFAGLIPVAVIADLIGVLLEMGPQLVDWSHRLVAMYQFDADRAVEGLAGGGGARLLRLRARSRACATRRSRRRPRQPVAHRRRRQRGDIDEDELVATVILLLNAGHEATVQAIGNGVEAGCAEEALVGEVFADETATAATVEELLRLFDPPLHLFARHAARGIWIGQACGT